VAEVSVTVLARACHITPRRVQQLVAEGMPRTNRGKYDLGVCMSWYIRYLQEQVERRTPNPNATPPTVSLRNNSDSRRRSKPLAPDAISRMPMNATTATPSLNSDSPAIFISIAVYTVASMLGYFLSAAWQFFALAFLVGTVQGGSQALSRSLFARMIPKHKSSEYFGFFSVFEKFAGVAEPAVFAASVTLFGNSRAAVLSIVIFFILGALVLMRVNVVEGEAQAARAVP